MKWRVINASVRGSVHQRTGLPNQDAVDYAATGKGEAPVSVLAVSDGHGSGRHFRSQVGSMLAAHVSVQVVLDALSQNNNAGGLGLIELAEEIVGTWLVAVAQDLANNPFTEAELSTLSTAESERSRDTVLERPELAYGATLLIAAATESRVSYLQLGDGDILAVAADGATTRPVPGDARLVGNATTSLCQPEAWREFRSAETTAREGLPALVLLSSDGYLNSFRSEEDFLQIGQDYLQILREQGTEVLRDELPNILTEATQQGSGDDITLGILHMEVLPVAVAMPARTSAAGKEKQHISQSTVIRELTRQKDEQEKKLSELESGYEGAQLHVRHLRLIVGAMVLVAVLALTQRFWWPTVFGGAAKHPAITTSGVVPRRPGKGGPVSPLEPSAGDPASSPLGAPLPGDLQSPANGDKPGAGIPASGEKPVAADRTECVLELSSGSELSLISGKTISRNDLSHSADKHPYAKVKRQDNLLYLTNLSSDTWSVTTLGSDKPHKYSNGDIVPLRQDTKIIFNKSMSASVAFHDKAS